MGRTQRPDAVRIFAPAKINLALHVTGWRDDGYHDIDTLVAFAAIGDMVVCRPATDLRLSVGGPFAAALTGGDDNLVANLVERAGGRVQQAARGVGLRAPGAELSLTKILPVASGVGGGSADAAATLIGLHRLWDLPGDFDLRPLARQLGADVAMCVESAPLRARGRGDRIDLIDGVRPLPAVLVNPAIAVATADVFAALGEKQNSGIGELPAEPFAVSFLARLRNNLEEPARRIAPAIDQALALLRGHALCRLARMTGSGATCFALCDSPEAAAEVARHVVDRHPDWWCAATQLGKPERFAPSPTGTKR